MNKAQRYLSRVPGGLLSLATTVLILWLTLSPDPIGGIDIPLFKGADKVIHALMFGFLTCMILLDRQRRRGWKHMGWGAVAISATLSSALGIGIEFAQDTMQLGRSKEISDMIADCAGSILAGVAYMFVQRWWTSAAAAPGTDGENRPDDNGAGGLNDAPGDHDGDPPPAGHRHLIRPTWLRRTLKTLGCLLAVILLLPAAIYIPPVQRFLTSVACDVASDATGMKIAIGHFGLRFPLDISLGDVHVIEASGDTMVSAREAIADVRLMPLLHLDVQLKRLRLIDGYYRMVAADSSLIMKVRAGLLDVDGKSSADLRNMHIDLNKVYLRDGDLSLYMNVWKKQNEPADTAASTPIYIGADDLRLENFRFAMSMLPTIDTLAVRAADISIRKAKVDLGANLVAFGYAGVSDGDFTYLTPTPEYIRTHPAPVDTTAPGPPMVIRGDSIDLDRFKALYGVKGARPQPGFDASYIQLSGISVGLKDFYNESSTVRLPLTRLMARERSGLAITSGSGLVTIDSIGLGVDNVRLRTLHSDIAATAAVPFAMMALNPEADMSADVTASVGPQDIRAFMPSLAAYLRQLPSGRPIRLDLKAAGSLSSLDITGLTADIPDVLSLRAKGWVDNPLDMKRLRGSVDLDGRLTGPKTVDAILGGTGYDIPTLTLTGSATADRQTYTADIDLLTSAGDLAANGRVSLTAETYDADIDITDLDVARFVPDIGIGHASMHIDARGAGFNPTRPGAAIDAHADVARLVYNGHPFEHVTLDATLDRGAYEVELNSPDPLLDAYIHAKGTVAPDDYTFDIIANLRHFDLHQAGITADMCSGNGNIYAVGSASPGRWLYDVDLRVDGFDLNLPERYIHLPDGLTATLTATEGSVDCHLDSQLTYLDFTSATGLRNVVDGFTRAADIVSRQLDSKLLSVDSIRNELPPFDLQLNASGRGLMRQLLVSSGITLDTLYADLRNDDGLRGVVGLNNLTTTGIGIDTLSLNLADRGSLLDYKLHMGNRPGTLDEFAKVDINGYLGGNRASASLTQHNIAGEMGYRLGLTAALVDSTISVHLTPLRATIAYLPWKLNADNHIDYNLFSNQVTANLRASSNESSILLMTERSEKGYDELHINLDNIHIQDFLRMSVFAPPITASVSSDLRLHLNDRAILGKGTLDINNFTYAKANVGSFNLDFGAGVDFDGNTAARLAMKVDGRQAMILKGIVRNDSTGMKPENLTLTLDRFPLKVANPFLGANVARVAGYLSGDMKMGGSFTAPLLNGSLSCDSVSVFIPMMGSGIKFDTEPLTVTDNVVKFNDFDLWGANSNPLTINGTVDARNFSDIRCDIGIKGSNFQLVGNDKRARSDLYGKLFLNLNATARGPLNHFDVNARIGILSATDITYAIPEEASAIVERSDGGVVKFVQFSDTLAVAKTDTVAPAMSMRINANLNIQPGTQATVILSANGAENGDLAIFMSTGTDRIELSPSGDLNYFQNYMGDMRLNGQLFLGHGFARYSIPVVGEKKFVFDPQSYILWNGGIMNPTLNIHAVDNVKANVTQEGSNSRLMTFDVGLNVTQTLSNPKIMFDLSTKDDLTVQNQLQSMSAEQRSTEALNLLLYNQYTGPGIKAKSDLSGNMLYSFITSKLNSWAANNIRGVDLTFGIDQYDKTVNGQNSTTTSYSYQVSKSLFNNKFKIVVGGNYSTDANADENFAQNLLSDVSFEYILKQTSNLSMYIRLFRHNGFESILEGEVTETGVGFVMRRRMSSFSEMFRFLTRRNRHKEEDEPAPADSTAAAAGADHNTTESR